MRTTILLIILTLLLAVSGAALAGDAADLARPHVKQLVGKVEGLTGWDCQYRIADNQSMFAVVMWCEK